MAWILMTARSRTTWAIRTCRHGFLSHARSDGAWFSIKAMEIVTSEKRPANGMECIAPLQQMELWRVSIIERDC